MAFQCPSLDIANDSIRGSSAAALQNRPIVTCNLAAERWAAELESEFPAAKAKCTRSHHSFDISRPSACNTFLSLSWFGWGTKLTCYRQWFWL